MLGDGRLVEALNDFVQESADEEPLGSLYRNTAGAQIKHFVFVDLAGSRAVGASNVVGQNLQAGH